MLITISKKLLATLKNNKIKETKAEYCFTNILCRENNIRIIKKI